MAEVALAIIMTGGIAIQCFLVWLSYKQFESAKSLNDIKKDLEDLSKYLKQQSNSQR